MNPTPRELLHRLFEYIGEQIKEIDPRAFNISETLNFRREPSDIAGLPGIKLDVQVQADHIWLYVERLEAGKPPKVSPANAGLFRISANPSGALPVLEESSIARKLGQLTEGLNPEERSVFESAFRMSAKKSLEVYSKLWLSWAEGEKPRHKTIALYADLFALKHQMEADETAAKPLECVWGIGVATWQLSFEAAPFVFQYPLLTQAVEISLNEKNMALDVRPKDSRTRTELQAFVASAVTGAADVEKTAKEYLQKNSERSVLVKRDPLQVRATE